MGGLCLLGRMQNWNQCGVIFQQEFQRLMLENLRLMNERMTTLTSKSTFPEQSPMFVTRLRTEEERAAAANATTCETNNNNEEPKGTVAQY